MLGFAMLGLARMPGKLMGYVYCLWKASFDTHGIFFTVIMNNQNQKILLYIQIYRITKGLVINEYLLC